MQKKGLIYWLFNKDKKPLYVDGAGLVQPGDPITFLKPDGSPAHLTRAPDGWKDTLVKFARNIKYWGLFRDFTVPMKFHADGGKIVRYLMWTFGVEAICYIGISKLNRTTFPDNYDAWYRGELDFSKFDQKLTDTTIQVVEGGLSKLLKANEGTKYEIDIDNDPEARLVTMDGLNFKATDRYETVNNGIAGFERKYFDLTYLTTEGTTIGITNYSVFGESVSAFDFTSPRFFMNTVDNVTPHFKFKFSFMLPVGGDVGIWLNTQTRVFDLVPTAHHNSGKWYTYSFDFDLPLLAGENVYLVGRVQSIGNAIQTRVEDFTVTYDNKYKTTTIKGLTPLRLWQRLVEKMTNGAYTGASSFLQSLENRLLITSAMALRNHEGDPNASAHESKIKTSVADFHKSFLKKGIGIGIENDQLIMEKIEYFFKNNIALVLGEVDDLQVVVAEDLIYNTIKTGYPNQTYDSVNGLDEFNVTQQYTTPITRIVKELDLVSVYRADMYGIELTRVNLDGKNTTDNEADNDTFFIGVMNPVSLTASFFNALKTISAAASSPVVFDSVTPHADVTVSGGSDEFTYTGADTRQVKLSGNVRVAPFDASITLSILLNGTSIKEVIMDNTGNYVIDHRFVIQQNDIVSLSIPGVAGLTDILDASLTIDFLAQTTFSLRREAYTSITGLLDPASAFNIEDLTPHRAFLPGDYGRILRSMLHQHDSEYIKYTTGEKNSQLKTVLGTVSVDEKADIQIAKLGARLFLPYYFKFTTSVPLSFLQDIKANPYGKISFIYKGVTLKGYLFDGGIKPQTNDKQSWTLLAAPDNDMTKLIAA